MFKIYTASAGSGKTTSLVAEYLSICLEDVTKYRNVLAITFTKNATAEMKSRIVDTLKSFSTIPSAQLSGSDRAIFDLVRKSTNLTEQTLKQNAGELLKRILFDYDNFSVSTIDSFFQRILRSFAFEFGINMNFNVEVSPKEYYQQTIDTLYNAVTAQNPELSKILMRLIERKLNEDGKWNIDRTLENLLRQACEDESAAIPLYAIDKYVTDNGLTLDNILNEVEKELNRVQADLATTIDQFRATVKKYGLTDDVFKQKSRGLSAWFDKLGRREVKLPSKTLYDYRKDENFLSKDFDSTSPNAVLANQSFCGCFDDAAEACKDDLNLRFHKKCIEDLQVLYELSRIIEAIKERDNKFFLSHTNFKIFNQIKDDETPYIYEKIGVKYEYFFIDEFQDTSEMQWNNMLPLVRESLANMHDTILFGDLKQAIYRFRNGDAQILHNLLKNGLQLPSLSEDSHPKQIKLDTNYRSVEPIVNFNNDLFTQFHTLKGFPDKLDINSYQQYYADVRQKTCKGDEQGYVCVDFLPPPAQQEQKSTFEDLIKEKVLWAVKDSLACGFDYKDIAVLSPTNKIASVVGDFLSQHQIPVISAVSLLLASSDEVGLIIAILRYLQNPQDDLSKMKIVLTLSRLSKKGNAKSQDADVLTILKKSANAKEYAAIDFQNDEDSFAKLLHEKFQITIQRAEWLQLPLYSLVTQIIAHTPIRRDNAFVVSFIDYLLDYLKSNLGEIGHFLEWWETKKSQLSITAPETINAVKISTIHKSKGLAYPVVIIPIKNKIITKTKKSFWAENRASNVKLPYLWVKNSEETSALSDDYREIHEEYATLDYFDVINLYYVAQTRPKTAMYLLLDTTEDDPKSKGGSKPFYYSRMVKDFIEKKIEIDTNYTRDETDDLRFWYYAQNHKAVAAPPAICSEMPISNELQIDKFTLDSLSTAFLGTAPTEEQERGNAVHDFLAKLLRFPQSEQELDTLPALAGHSYENEIRGALRTLMARPDYSRYFAPGCEVLNEVSVLENSDGLLEESTNRQLLYRPDRVVLLADETKVIDYKTGHPDQTVKEKYAKQIEKYVELFEKMGYPNVNGEIIYL